MVFESLQAELATIMAPAGIRFEWRSLKGVRGDEVSVELVVVQFKGTCDAANLGLRRYPPGALGWTHVSGGDVLPFSDVQCDGIRQFVRCGLAGLPLAAREKAFGRALGRVLAHELYHVFAGSRLHGAHGIAKPIYTVSELLADHLEFQAHDFDVLRSCKARAALNLPVGE